MLSWSVTLLFVLCFRVWAKTHERRAANALTDSIYRGVSEDAVRFASSLIARPTPTNELAGQIMATIPPFSLFFRLIYPIFAFSLVSSEERTPLASVLLDNEEGFYDLHDPDIFESYRRWKAAFFWDGVSAGVLVLVIISVFSRNIFNFLYY